MDQQTHHIALLCSRLDLPGGIERAVVNTANLFAEKGNTVSLIILDETAETFYPIHPAVNIIQQPMSFGITPEGNIISRKIKLLGDTLKLRKLLKELRPQTVISSEYPMTVALVLSGAKKYATTVSWEHHHFASLKKNKFWSSLCKLAYPGLDRIVCLNKTEAAHHERSSQAVVIPNFVENKTGRFSSGDSKTILSVGWLTKIKGIDLMMEAAKQVLHQHTDWKWKLVGDGEMKQQVLSFIEKENLQGRFILQQPGPEIEKEYLDSSLFVLASRFEAFPMVLLEALSFGIPCIAFDCPSGPAEIITHNGNGLLVEGNDPQQLANAITALITDDATRKRMGENAARSIDRFSPGTIYRLWEEMILATTKKKD